MSISETSHDSSKPVLTPLLPVEIRGPAVTVSPKEMYIAPDQSAQPQTSRVPTPFTGQWCLRIWQGVFSAISPVHAPDTLSPTSCFYPSGKVSEPEERCCYIYPQSHIIAGKLAVATPWGHKTAMWETSPISTYCPRMHHGNVCEMNGCSPDRT